MPDEAINASANASKIANASANATEARQRFPPVVVEQFPDWPHHFRILSEKLGHLPNARPFKDGIRFLPKSAEEARVVQDYLTTATEQDSGIEWFCYDAQRELPLKIAIKGLPTSTSEVEIKKALEEKGFYATRIRRILPARGRAGCIYFTQLKRSRPERMHALYNITVLLCMTGVSFEGWRGSDGVAQCHRCQAFGHSSYRCHRRPRCVRCSGEHAVADCPRDEEEPATCANCGKPHAANYRHCPIYRKVARSRNIPVRPSPPPMRGNIPTSNKPSRAERRRWQRPEEEAQPTITPQPTEIPTIIPEARKKNKRGGRLAQRRRLAAIARATTPPLADSNGAAHSPDEKASDATQSCPATPQPPRRSATAMGRAEKGGTNLRQEVTQLRQVVGSLINYVRVVAAGGNYRTAATEVEAIARARGLQSTQDEKGPAIIPDGRPGRATKRQPRTGALNRLPESC